MAGVKRGVFFTLSMMLLGSALLSFIFFLSEQSTKSADTVTYLMEIDRASDKYAEVEDSLSRIISPSINISVQNSTVYISESLPLSENIEADLDRFAAFEANYSSVNVSMSLANLKGGYFIIQPSGAVMTNTAGEFGITPTGLAGAPEAYYLELVFQPGEVDNAAWLSVSNSSADTINVHVRVRDESYARVLDFYQLLDKTGASSLNVTNLGATVALVGFSSPGALAVQCPGNIGLKASISFTEPVHVEADDEISVKSSANRTGRVRIA